MRHFGIGLVCGALAACAADPNANLQGDVCSQLGIALGGLQSRLGGCGFTTSFSVADCDSVLASCSSDDQAQLHGAAECINLIPGGDCSSFPAFALDTIAAVQQTCIGTDTPTLSDACLNPGDPDAGVLGIATLVSNAVPVISSGAEQTDAGVDEGGNTVILADCPSAPATLTGTVAAGGACGSDTDCAPVCCACPPTYYTLDGLDAGLGDGNYLGAACQNGSCVGAQPYLCSLVAFANGMCP